MDLIKDLRIKAINSSPKILMAVGIVGVITSTVMACKATTKAKEIKNDKDEELKEIESCEYENEKDLKRDVRNVKIKYMVNIGKTYAPAVVLGAASIASILSSNNILKKRNMALTAAYNVVDKGFKDYRKRVTDKYGEEIDKELRYGLKNETISEKTVDENGKKKTKKTQKSVVNEAECSEYAKFFDASSCHWEKNPEYNLNFLLTCQSLANDKLRRQGYLFLNEVLDMLDIPRTKAGQIVGWVYDENNPVGDNYIDFGIYQTNRTANRNFVNGLEPVILLDFNVDGNILDKMN